MRIALSTLVTQHHVTVKEEMSATRGFELLGVSPTAPLSITLKAESVEDKLFVNLKVEGEVDARCDLCGEECKAPLFAEMDEELSMEDECFDPIEKVFDLDFLVEEAVVMSLPRTVRCKPDCKGLCPTCGVNLNYATCDCVQSDSPKGNNPFGALQELFSTGGAKNGSTKM
jgi:uncharacterized protein